MLLTALKSFRFVSASRAEPRTLRQDLTASIVDGTSHSVMVGIGETYLAAFALALGLGEVASGLVTTLPLLGGALLQLIAPWGVRRVGSLRRWVVLGAALQAACFVPMLILALNDQLSPWLVFPPAVWYWGAGLSTSGAWNTWMGGLIPANLRARVFASRTRLAQAGVFAGFVTGGILLQLGFRQGAVLPMFAALFAIAFLFRSVSAYSLWQQSDVALPTTPHRQVPVGEWLHRLRHAPDGKLLAYLLAIQCSIHISGAYFTPYLFKHLHFSYTEYMCVIACAYAGKSLASPYLGKVAQRWGARKLLFWGGLGIIPLSSLWLVSNGFVFLATLQLVGGVAWAAYELAMALLFIEAIREHERTSMLTMFNFAWSVATVTGSLIGAGLLMIGDKTPAAYLAVFAISSVARIGALGLLRRVPACVAPQDLPSDVVSVVEAAEAPTPASAVSSASITETERVQIPPLQTAPAPSVPARVPLVVVPPVVMGTSNDESVAA